MAVRFSKVTQVVEGRVLPKFCFVEDRVYAVSVVAELFIAYRDIDSPERNQIFTPDMVEFDMPTRLDDAAKAGQICKTKY